MTENNEPQEITRLFNKLCEQPRENFPKQGKSITAPSTHCVYVIRKDEIVLHVGRTYRGKEGLKQRLNNHLHGASSFAVQYLKPMAANLRDAGYTYQCLELKEPRKRALVEAYATGTLCPVHLGLGEAKDKKGKSPQLEGV
jgi:hypothetical protein